ncbi:cyanate transporter [Variovorax sp. PBL-E5]|uniref:cyanate transporter n=1 Tax=Variovorax sp. PBL-E5 TaxID=434014 RepID=UPI0013190A9D|nr:cyanate transporter [Variovorax sp. PBL-E5]VTU19708.1 putative transporter YycB [Variovorax sp. PBL-E5]
MTVADTPVRREGGIGFALLIVLVALNLRAFYTSSSPLLESIRSATGLGFQWAAMLTVLPMMTMGPMSLAGVAIGRRFGERAAILLGLATIAASCASRFFVTGDALPLLLSAALAGAGVGLVQALMPAVIKRNCPARMGIAMGLYSAALMGGGGLGAMGSPWVARLAGAWQAGLAVWALPALLALWAWSRSAYAAPVSARVPGARTDAGWLRCFANRRAWLLAVYFGLVNGGYTSLVAWLPHFYAQQGWSAAQGGAMLALMTAAQLVSALLLPALARGRRDLRPWLALTLLAQLAGFAGLLLNAPAAAAIVVVLGFGLGGSFALCMVLSLDHLPDPAQAGTLAAFMQAVGFMIAALAPFVTGAVREHTGSFGFAWAYLGAVVVLLLPLSWRLDPRGYARATAGLFGSPTSARAVPLGRAAHAAAE